MLHRFSCTCTRTCIGVFFVPAGTVSSASLPSSHALANPREALSGTSRTHLHTSTVPSSSKLISSLTSSSRPGTPSFKGHLGTAFFSPRKILTASVYLLRKMCSIHPSPKGFFSYSPLCRLIPAPFETFFCCLSLRAADSNS